MNRRQFLSALASVAALPSSARARMLEGKSPQDGERPLSTWQAAQRLHALRLAKPDELVQIIFFVDSNCPACADLWTWFASRPSPDLASLWIPVAYMRPSSEGRAISLLRARDPRAALAQNYGPGFDHVAWEGALPAATDVTANERTWLKQNTQFWKALFGATPLILYRQADGSIQQTLGLPPGGLDTLLPRLAPAKLGNYPVK